MSQSGKTPVQSLTPKRRSHRRWLTVVRVGRYGANNFTRNAWLTTAATAVMVVTLIIVFSTIVARNVFNDTIADLRQKLDISFYLKDDVTEENRQQLTRILRNESFITNVNYISKEQARQIYIKDEAADELENLEAIDILEGDNPFPASLRINIVNPELLDELNKVFERQEFKAALNPNPRFQPASQSERRDSIDNIAKAASFTERTGLALSIVAVTISILIIFNTIRMAIFNRRDEIQMMKLIGADKNFIQGPFIVEAVLYGVLAAAITSAIVFPLLLTRSSYLDQYGVMVGPTIEYLKSYAPLVIMLLIFAGALIGFISSFLAIRRYLKV